MKSRIAAIMGPGALVFGDYYNQMILRALVAGSGRFGTPFDVVISASGERVRDDLEACCRSDKYTGVLAAGNAMQEPTSLCAKEFSDRRFALVDGSAGDLANVVSYSSDPSEISFLCGQIAMSLGDSGSTGCVLWSDNWVAREWIGSYVAGAKSVRDDATVYYSFAPSQEEAHTKASLQYSKGVGIIMGHAGSADLGVIRAAKESGRFTLGFLDERKIDPDVVLFDVVRNLEPIVFDALKRISAPRFAGGKLIKMGLREGNFDLDIANAHDRIGAKERRTIAALRRRVVRGDFESRLKSPGEAVGVEV